MYEEDTPTYTPAAQLFAGYEQVLEQKARSRKTERGELLRYFSRKTGYGIPRLCAQLAHLGYDAHGVKSAERELLDLYYIKSVCDQDAGRRYTDRKTGQERTLTWGQVFNQLLKPRSYPQGVDGGRGTGTV